MIDSMTLILILRSTITGHGRIIYEFFLLPPLSLSLSLSHLSTDVEQYLIRIAGRDILPWQASWCRKPLLGGMPGK